MKSFRIHSNAVFSHQQPSQANPIRWEELEHITMWTQKKKKTEKLMTRIKKKKKNQQKFVVLRSDKRSWNWKCFRMMQFLVDFEGLITCKSNQKVQWNLTSFFFSQVKKFIEFCFFFVVVVRKYLLISKTQWQQQISMWKSKF